MGTILPFFETINFFCIKVIAICKLQYDLVLIFRHNCQQWYFAWNRINRRAEKFFVSVRYWNRMLGKLLQFLKVESLIVKQETSNSMKYLYYCWAQQVVIDQFRGDDWWKILAGYLIFLNRGKQLWSKGATINELRCNDLAY